MTQTPYGAPQQPPVPPQYNPQPPAQDPGKTLGIIGLIVSILCGGLIGLVISIIAFNQSKKAGFKNNIALAGIIVGAIVIVLTIISYATGILTINGR